MLYGNNYENSMIQAAEKTEKALAAAGEEQAHLALEAMRQANAVAGKMSYYGETDWHSAAHARNCLETLWLTARDHPEHPALDQMNKTSARICREVASVIPPRVNNRTKNETATAASEAERAVIHMAPEPVRQLIRETEELLRRERQRR